MKRIFILMGLSVLALGFAACGDDGDEVAPDAQGGTSVVVGNDEIKNDPSKLIVTGGLQSASLGYGESLNWGYSDYSGEWLSGFYADRFTVLLYGYANLLPEMKILLGNGLSVGIEVADNADFSNARRVYATSLDANSKFTVETWAQAGRTLYWRAFLLAGDMRQYEEARSLQMPSLEAGLTSLPLELGEASGIGNTNFYVSIKAPNGVWKRARKVGLAYSEDPSALTAAKMKTALDRAEWAKYNYNDFLHFHSGDVDYLRPLSSLREDLFEVIELQPSTTYYYCEYVYVEDGGTGYITVGDIQQATTTGISLAEVRNYVDVSITPDDARRQWQIRYTSTLERHFPQYRIKYEIHTGLTLDGGYAALCYNTTNVATPSSYSGVIPYPTLLAMVPSSDDSEVWAASEVLKNLYERIATGTADASDRAEYAKLLEIIGAIPVSDPDVPYFIQLIAIITDEEGHTLHYPVATGTCFGGGAVQHISVADFLARADTETTYELTGIVQNIVSTTYGNFDLVENGHTVFIYGLLDFDGNKKNFASMGITEGTQITVSGKYYLYYGKPEIVDAQIVRIGK